MLNSGANSLRRVEGEGSFLGGRLRDIPTPDAQLSALNLSSREAELWGEGGSQVETGSGVGMECPAGTVCDQRPFALSYSTRAGRAGQRLRRQLLGSRAGAAVATRGARRLRSPAGEARRPPLSCCRGRPGPQEAGAIVRPEPGTAPPEATFARPELPSLAGIFAWDGGVTAVATAFLPQCIPLCMKIYYHF